MQLALCRARTKCPGLVDNLLWRKGRTVLVHFLCSGMEGSLFTLPLYGIMSGECPHVRVGQRSCDDQKDRNALAIRRYRRGPQCWIVDNAKG